MPRHTNMAELRQRVLADTPREEARTTLELLRSLGIDHTIMLIGDNEALGRVMDRPSASTRSRPACYRWER